MNGIHLKRFFFNKLNTNVKILKGERVQLEAPDILAILVEQDLLEQRVPLEFREGRVLQELEQQVRLSSKY